MALQTDSGPVFESKSFFIFDAMICDGVIVLFLLCATIFPEKIEAVIGWKGGWRAWATECVRDRFVIAQLLRQASASHQRMY